MFLIVSNKGYALHWIRVPLYSIRVPIKETRVPTRVPTEILLWFLIYKPQNLVLTKVSLK